MKVLKFDKKFIMEDLVRATEWKKRIIKYKPTTEAEKLSYKCDLDLVNTRIKYLKKMLKND